MAEEDLTPSDFSVLIPIDSYSDYLEEAVKSVIDDVPSDVKIVLALHNPNQVFIDQINSLFNYSNIEILNLESQTLGELLNQAIHHIDTRYIIRMDSDDVWLKGRFQIQKNAIQQLPDAAVLSSGMLVENNLWGNIYTNTVQNLYQVKWQDLVLGCPIFHPTTVLNREVVVEAGGYGSKLVASEDFYLWSKLLNSQQKIYITPEIVIKHRVHEHAHSLKNKRKQNEEVAHLRMNHLLYKFKIRGCTLKHEIGSTFFCRLKFTLFAILEFFSFGFSKKKVYRISKFIELET